MTYFRIKGDDGAHEVLQALVSSWKPVGHVQQANPRPLIPEYSNTGHSSSILPPVYSNPDQGYLYPEHPLDPVSPVPTRILEFSEGSYEYHFINNAA